MTSKSNAVEIPDIVIDRKNGKEYVKGRFLGKGGFAKCFELTDKSNNQTYAGKVVAKSLLTKAHQREKMTQEIHIHRSLKHEHIVGFEHYFEDENNVYIILEYCRRRSLMELHRRRRVVTDLEARYFMRHILLACKYLHAQRVIHRDLKLGNLFLDNNLHLKVGDFGLATHIDYEGERKRTLCGTPNYIAPEILSKRGHSYEVDVWSIGCILYTLLVGKPPFETTSLKETYERIKTNKYVIPSNIGSAAANMITAMLNPDPARRPTVEALLNDPYMTEGYLPSCLPQSCLSTAPRFDAKAAPAPRRPFSIINNDNELVRKVTPIKNALPNRVDQACTGSNNNNAIVPDEVARRQHIDGLREQLQRFMSSAVNTEAACDDDALDPASIPVYWISKWVDYTDKYGLGYQLCDGSVGVLFNDATRICLLPDGQTLNYIDSTSTEVFHTVNDYPQALQKKMVLLRYFQNYMAAHLMMAGAEAAEGRDGDQLSRLPFLRTWFRTRSAIVLFLSNGTLQINFFQDHSKIVLCPLMGAVSYIDSKREFRTYRLSLLSQHGCSRDLHNRLRYAQHMIDRLDARHF